MDLLALLLLQKSSTINTT